MSEIVLQISQQGRNEEVDPKNIIGGSFHDNAIKNIVKWELGRHDRMV